MPQIIDRLIGLLEIEFLGVSTAVIRSNTRNLNAALDIIPSSFSCFRSLVSPIG